jgi:hypothetical protein
MRGVYEGSILCSALAATKTVILITAPSTTIVELLSASITDASNATNQQLAALWQKVTTIGSAAGTSLTPTKTEQGDQASASTVLGNLTVEPTTYTTNTGGGYRGFPTLGGWEWAPIPEERIYLAPSSVWGLRILTSTWTAQDTIVRFTYREIG